MALRSAETREEVLTALHDGASIDATDCASQTALHRACRTGNIEVAMALIENGASMYAGNSVGWTPLHYACISGHIKLAMAITTSVGVAWSSAPAMQRVGTSILGA